MCQVNGQSEVIPKEEIRLRVSNVCMKCKQPASVIARIHDPFCRDCFQVYFTHRFRATVGKSKAVRNGEKVLIAFSGGHSSCAMLHLVKEGLGDGVHKKLRYVPGVIFVDENVCLDQDETEYKTQLEEIKIWLKKSSFPAYVTSLEEVMSETKPAVRLISDDQSSDNAGDSCEKLGSGDSDSRERLKRLFSNTSSLTTKEDLIQLLRLKLLKEVAKQLGYTKIMLGDSGTRLATVLLGDLAKGRGGTVYQDMSFLDGRDEDVSIIRPMREFSSKEVVAFSHQCRLRPVFIPRVFTKTSRLASINSLTEDFVNGLQSSFPSTVSTVLKTGEKLTSDECTGGAKHVCVLCQSPVDSLPSTCSASAATQYSLSLQKSSSSSESNCAAKADCDNSSENTSCCGQGDGSCQSRKKHTELTPADLSGVLCYGCQVMMRDVKDLHSLPSAVIAYIQKQKRRDEMRLEIQDFLLVDER